MHESIMSKQHEMSRRTFLKTSCGVIAMTVVGLPRAGIQDTKIRSWSPTPGVAKQRFEGLDKVTGQKIFARDINAADLAWPEKQWYAMYLRALTVTREFIGVDLDQLDPSIRPIKTILGSDFARVALRPKLEPNRDRIIDEQLIAEHQTSNADKTASISSMNHPDAVKYDLVVQPKHCADFLGQAVALLLFDDKKKYRAAKQQMQFDDASYQIYGPESGKKPGAPTVFKPDTHYVKESDSVDPSKDFSYYNSLNDSTYNKNKKSHISNIDKYVNDTPNLIKYGFSANMRAMDPMFMEPESGIIWLNDGTTTPYKGAPTLNILLGTQSPDNDLRAICSMYGNCATDNKIEKATLISCYPGGGFGGRDSSPFSLMLGLCAEFANGNPVKLEYDRFEQFRVGLKRHACSLTGQIAVSANQEIKVVKMDMSFDSGGRENLSPYVAQLACLCAGGSYRFPMGSINGKATQSENVSAGSQRGFGGPQAFLAIETAIDEICVSQEWDPIVFRKKNVLEQNNGTTIIGGPIQQELRLNPMLDLIAKHPLWRERQQIKKSYAHRDELYGTGLAMSLQAYGTSGDAVIASITLDNEGVWHLRSDAVDMGNGSATTLGVVIGSILGANAGYVSMGDSTLFSQTGLMVDRRIGTQECNQSTRGKLDDAPAPTWNDAKYTKKDVGSSSACLTALHQVHVAQQAALAVMAQTVLPAASLIWGVSGLSESDVKWVNGLLTLEGHRPIPLSKIADIVYHPDNTISGGVVAHAYFQESWVRADFVTASGKRRYELDGLAHYPTGASDGTAQPIWRSNTQAMDCHSNRESRYVWSPCINVVGLTVNQKTGRVQIENIVSVLNAGHVHVPELVSGQSQGGVAMAIGWTLFEDMPPGMAGPANGTWNLNRYHVPHYRDVPLATTYEVGKRSQELIVMPESKADQKQGRGIAEAVMCSIAPAISNALRDATGVRFTSLPITPEKILEGMDA